MAPTASDREEWEYTQALYAWNSREKPRLTVEMARRHGLDERYAGLTASDLGEEATRMAYRLRAAAGELIDQCPPPTPPGRGSKGVQ